MTGGEAGAVVGGAGLLTAGGLGGRSVGRMPVLAGHGPMRRMMGSGVKARTGTAPAEQEQDAGESAEDADRDRVADPSHLRSGS